MFITYLFLFGAKWPEGTSEMGGKVAVDMTVLNKDALASHNIEQ